MESFDRHYTSREGAFPQRPHDIPQSGGPLHAKSPHGLLSHLAVLITGMFAIPVFSAVSQTISSLGQTVRELHWVFLNLFQILGS